MRTRRSIGLGTLTALVSLGITLGLGEVLIRIFSPCEYLYPRYDFSAGYGLIPIAGAVMVHGIPGKYEFRYTVNSMHSRGEVVEPGASGLPTVVVLGDSYSFGLGVNDGEVFPTVMQRELAGRADVVNLGAPGWGLTQEIRRYYELGAAYDPKIVILQFCINDPQDNLANRVTWVEHGEFKFVDSQNPLNFIKKYLSRSCVQRTQLYNFFRTRASIISNRALIHREAKRLEAAQPDRERTGVSVTEDVYVEMLETFAPKLRAEGRALWVISADHNLDPFPRITASVRALDARGDLRYIEVVDWLAGHEPYDSPEGHLWGTVAHRVIGEHLAREVAATLQDTRSKPAP